MLAWCIQKIGSAGAVGIQPIVPPTQTWTPLWMFSRPPVNVGKVDNAITPGVLDAMVASQDEGPGDRVTVIGDIGGGIGTVGVNDASQAGKVCDAALVQFQYGIVTSGWMD